MKRMLGVLVLTAVLLCTSCFAVETDAAESQREEFGIDAVEEAVPEEAKDLLGDLSADSDLDFQEKLSALWSAAVETLTARLHSGVKTVAMVLMITALLSLIHI